MSLIQDLAKNQVASLRSLWRSESHSWVPINLTPKQELFLNLPHLEVLYGGAAGGGKSIALAAGALQYADHPNYHALLLRRTFADLSKPGSLMDILYGWLSGSGARFNDQKKQWRMPSGAMIQLGYLEVPQDKYRYKSDEYNYIAFDELTSFEEEPYVYLISRLRRRKDSNIPLRMRAGTNPGDIGAIWVKNRFVPDQFDTEDAKRLPFVEKTGVDGAGNSVTRAFVPALMTDNPHLDQDAYRYSLDQIDPVSREQLLKGDWQIQIKGDIYPEWDERRHVISWSEFQGVVGESRIPASWLVGIGFDWGSTESHPYVVTFAARAPESSPLAGKVFLYKTLSGYAEPPRMVAEKISDALRKDNSFDRCYVWLMSHEAKSERDTFIMEHGLPFGPWKPDRSAGIAQVRDFLQVRGDSADLFHPSLQGSPSLYLIVEDDEMGFARTDAGFARHRMEFPLYHYNAQGVPENKKLNDAMDSIRGLAAVFFPPSAPRTEEEIIAARIKEFQLDVSPGPVDSYQNVLREMSRQYYIKELVEEERAKSKNTHPMDRFKSDSLG